MRTTFITFIITFLSAHVCFAQNLILNGDFETHAGCPAGFNQLWRATSWQNPTTATPDYFHICSSDPYSGVPSNMLGYQHAHSDSAYAGILLYEIFDTFQYREYLQASFTAPLLAGTRYHFQMYVNNGDYMYYHVNEIGIYFSDTSVYLSTRDTLPFVPQIVGDYSVADTIGWTLISGDYVAHGGENFLLIGNFKSDANTTYTIQYGPILPPSSWAYIDDVSLVPDTCPDITLSFTTSVTPPQSNNGAVRVLASDGAPPYQYSLDNLSFQPGNTFNSLALGIYQMYVVDSQGCTAHGTFIVDRANCCPNR